LIVSFDFILLEEVHGQFKKLLSLALVLFPLACLGEYETNGWGGEGIPRLAASKNELILYKSPNTETSKRKIKYKEGWLIVWDQSKRITIKSAMWIVKKEIVKGNCGVLSPGDNVEYLQYEAEGWGTFRVKGNICSTKVIGDRYFDKNGERPEVEWWVRVLDYTISPIGWLLVNEEQVKFLRREF